MFLATFSLRKMCSSFSISTVRAISSSLLMINIISLLSIVGLIIDFFFDVADVYFWFRFSFIDFLSHFRYADFSWFFFFFQGRGRCWYIFWCWCWWLRSIDFRYAIFDFGEGIDFFAVADFLRLFLRLSFHAISIISFDFRIDGAFFDYFLISFLFIDFLRQLLFQLREGFSRCSCFRR